MLYNFLYSSNLLNLLNIVDNAGLNLCKITHNHLCYVDFVVPSIVSTSHQVYLSQLFILIFCYVHFRDEKCGLVHIRKPQHVVVDTKVSLPKKVGGHLRHKGLYEIGRRDAKKDIGELGRASNVKFKG